MTPPPVHLATPVEALRGLVEALEAVRVEIRGHDCRGAAVIHRTVEAALTSWHKRAPLRDSDEVRTMVMTEIIAHEGGGLPAILTDAVLDAIDTAVLGSRAGEGAE